MISERVLNVTGAGMGWARRRPWGPMAAGARMVLADIAREAPGA
ncbi:hypothetical protein ACLBX9_00230 [Methylobacterium sp. A49B]